MLDREYLLRYLPIIDRKSADGCQMSASVITGDEEKQVASSTPVALRSSTLQAEQRYSALRDTALVDLSGFRGRAVSIQWTLQCEGESAPPRGAIGRLKLQLKRQGADRPHVLLVCADTLRYDRAFGEKGKNLMPRLQNFSKEAVVYARAYSSSSWTLPSITSVLTGLNPRFHRTGRLIEKGDLTDWKQERKLLPGQFRTGWSGEYYVFGAYPDSLENLTERLERAGYETAMVVSNHFYDASGLTEDGPDIVYTAGGVPGNVVNEAAFDILDSLNSEQPLFLLVHYMDVHQYFRWYFDREYPEVESKTPENTQVPRYEAGVSEVDRHFGDLLLRWRESVGIENSLIVFYADHGEHLQDSGGPPEGHGNSMHEAVLHIPLMIRYPNFLEVDPGITDGPASLVDIYPTIMDILKLDSPGHPAGSTSLLPMARNRVTTDPNRILFADYQLYGDELSSVRHDQLKLVINFSKEEMDLFETSPSAEILGQHPIEDLTKKNQLLEAFRAYARTAETTSSQLKSNHEIDEDEMREQLKALGYID
jgi:arylsulfatase A-like enzyme